MFSLTELLRGIVAPALLAGSLTAIGLWRGWRWAIPVAVAAAFLTGYALLAAAVPALPPRNGTDWLFWLAIPLAALGVLDAAVPRRFNWLLGAAAGLSSLAIVLPVVPGAISSAGAAAIAVAAALAGAALLFALDVADHHLGPAAVLTALCIAAAGAGVTVMSSNQRVLGFDGLAAAAALGAPAVLTLLDHLRSPTRRRFTAPLGRPASIARPAALLALPLTITLLIGGHAYADPGITWPQLTTLAAAPALLLLALLIPPTRPALRVIVGLLAVTVAVAAVTGPAALAAKNAAETMGSDPYQ